ncbi:MAG: FimV/HubP family polar landmark protein [Candidatus Igneacidithiobacillus chanchocoensis]
MKKYWAQTLLSLGIALPGAAQALGLGNLIVLSGAGEPFQAEIPIVSAHSSDLAEMNAGIADPSAYAMIHLPEAASSRDWKFSLRTGAKPAIVIQSPAPLPSGNTPFLVQLDWAGGQIVREYQAVPGAATRIQTARVHDISADVPVVDDYPSGLAPQPRRGRAASAVTAAEGSCLYSLAQTVSQQRGVTLLQAMTGLFRENPQAFINGDPSLLRAGVRLRVPSTASMRAIGARESAALFHPTSANGAPTAATTSASPKAQTSAAVTSSAAPVAMAVKALPTASVASTKSQKTTAARTAFPTALATSAAVAAPAQSNPVTADAASTKVVAAGSSAAAAGGSDDELQALQKALRLAQLRLNIAQQQLSEKTAELNALQRQTHAFPWLWVSLGANLLFILALLLLLRRRRQAAAEASAAPFTAAEQDPRLRDRRQEPVVAAPPVASPQQKPRPVAADTPPVLPAAVTPAPVPAYPVHERLKAPVSTPMAPPASRSLPPVAEETDTGRQFAVDPIEQAQLYHTYGKTDLAISVLQEAIEQDPQRRAFYEHLLPLYVETGNHSAFLDLSDRMRDQFHIPEDSLPTWDELGQGKTAEAARLPTEPADLPQQPVAPEPQGHEEEPQTSDAPLQRLEFDFGDSWQHEEADAEPTSRPAAHGLFAELDEHFKHLSPEAEPVAEDGGESEHPAAASALSFDDGWELAGAHQEQAAKPDDWDATGPKLELARAYIEMKDAASARELLEEVQKSGNPQQREEAAALLLEL